MSATINMLDGKGGKMEDDKCKHNFSDLGSERRGEYPDGGTELHSTEMNETVDIDY